MSVERGHDENAAPNESEMNLVDVALVFAESLRMLILLPLAAGLIALAISFAIPSTFTATTTLLPPQQQPSLAAALTAQLGALAGPGAAAAGIKNPADIYVAMLRSRTVADRVIERFRLKQLYEAKYDEQARMILRSRTKVTASRDGLITVSVDDRDPKRAADLTNGYVEALLSLTQDLAVTEAGQRRVFFERQLKHSRDDLTRAELALRAAGINEATLNTVPESALEFVATLKAKVTAQEVKVAALRGFMTESNPEFRQAQNELAALRAQLGKMERNDGAKAIGRGSEYTERLREFKYHQTLFELMAKQYELARLDEAREGAVIQVLDAALPPEFKSRPKKAQITLLTTLLAFLAAMVAVLLRYAARRSATNPEHVRKLWRLRQLLLFRRA